MGLKERVRDWWGPTKKDLALALQSANEINRRFPRRPAIASGVPMSWGEYEHEHNTKLQGAARFDEFDKMEADPHIKAVLMDQTLPLLTAEWEFKPASDDRRDREIAALCTANLLRKSTEDTEEFGFGRDYWCQTSWAQRLAEHLQMLRDGFSISVPTFRRVGTKVVYDRMQWIEPETVDGTQPWVLSETDEIEGVNRKYNTPADSFVLDEFLPAERIKLFVWDLRGARYDGRSFLRSMYGAFIRKEFILRQAAIWAQKVGAGIPLVSYDPDLKPDDIAKVKQLARAARGSAPAEAYGAFPKDKEGRPGVDVSYWGAETGEVDRMRGLIRGENEEIGHGGGRASASLGETETGSRSLGETKGRKEIKLTQAIGIYLCEHFNHGPANLKGVTEELVDLDYASVGRYPELVCTKVDPFENFDETVTAWEKGIIPKVPEARRQIVEGVLGLNLPEDAYEIQEIAPPPPPGSNGDQTRPSPGASFEPPSEQESDESDVAAVALAGESKEAFRARIAPLLEPMEGAPKGAGFRGPTRLEARVLNLAAVRESFRVGERDFLAVARKGHRAMIGELMKRLRAGKITTRNIGSQRRSKFKGEAALKKQFVTVARRVGREGMAHVKTELSVQVTREEVA